MSPAKFATVAMKTVVLYAVAILILAGAGYYLFSPEQTTKITVYDPTGFSATEEVSGECFTGSIAAPRQGAFRCIAGNALFDPCFTTNPAVACPIGDPEENQGTLLKLTKPLPEPPEAWENPPDLSNPSPWYTELEGGGVCGKLTGTRPPNWDLGCSVPDITEPAFCMLPVPVVGKTGLYATVCGTFSDELNDVVPKGIYYVTEMWL